MLLSSASGTYSKGRNGKSCFFGSRRNDQSSAQRENIKRPAGGDPTPRASAGKQPLAGLSVEVVQAIGSSEGGVASSVWRLGALVSSLLLWARAVPGAAMTASAAQAATGNFFMNSLKLLPPVRRSVVNWRLSSEPRSAGRAPAARPAPIGMVMRLSCQIALALPTAVPVRRAPESRYAHGDSALIAIAGGVRSAI